MKKLTCMVLSVCLLVALCLTGCAPPPTANEATANTSAPSAASSGAEATAPGSESTGPKKRIAVIVSGSINDLGWNQDVYEALMELETELDLETSFQENVSAADAKDVLRNYASEGYDLVVTGEQYHTEAMIEVATEFPDQAFGIVNGYVGAPNVIALTGTNWQSSYLAGILAANEAKNGNVGILTATDSATARRMVDAFNQGAASAKPDINVIHAFSGSFNDVVKGKEMAKSIIQQGAEVLYTQSGQVNVGAIEAAQEAGIKAIGAIVDMSDVAPDTVLASAMLPPGNMLKQIVNGYFDGTLSGSETVVVMGLKEGVEELRLNPALEGEVPAEVKEAIATAQQEIIDGTIDIPLPE